MLIPEKAWARGRAKSPPFIRELNSFAVYLLTGRIVKIPENTGIGVDRVLEGWYKPLELSSGSRDSFHDNELRSSSKEPPIGN